MDPAEVGRLFVDETFPEALCAFVGGSWLRDEATSTSDLDIVIITTGDEAPFRASYSAHGWPIEAFVHTIESYRRYAVSDGKRNRPSICTLAVESIVVRDSDDTAQHIRVIAREILDQGPTPLSTDEIDQRRYGLTDLLDDFIGCDRHDEGILIAAQIAKSASDLILLLNGHWIGDGKWILRALCRFEPDRADELSGALIAYCRDGEKERLTRFAEAALEVAGGRLFEGYYSRGT